MSGARRRAATVARAALNVLFVLLGVLVAYGAITGLHRQQERVRVDTEVVVSQGGLALAFFGAVAWLFFVNRARHAVSGAMAAGAVSTALFLCWAFVRVSAYGS